MESTLQIMPVQRTSRNFGEYAEEAVIIEEPVVKSSVSFPLPAWRTTWATRLSDIPANGPYLLFFLKVKDNS